MPVTVVMADDDVVELEIYLFPDNTVMQVYGTIHGPPISKPPPRVGKNGHVYNPLSGKMNQEKTRIQNLLEPTGLLSGAYKTIFPNPETPLKMSARYYMPRPLSDFIGRDRERGLVSSARPPNSVAVKDADNITKYLQDIFSGSIYPDDKQLSSLDLDKSLHSDGRCEGKIVFRIEEKRDLPPELLPFPVELFQANATNN